MHECNLQFTSHARSQTGGGRGAAIRKGVDDGTYACAVVQMPKRMKLAYPRSRSRCSQAFGMYTAAVYDLPPNLVAIGIQLHGDEIGVSAELPRSRPIALAPPRQNHRAVAVIDNRSRAVIVAGTSILPFTHKKNETKRRETLD